MQDVSRSFTVLQLNHGEVERNFQHYYSYSTAEFNAIFINITVIPVITLVYRRFQQYYSYTNINTVIPRRKLTPFTTILQLYQVGI